MAHFAHRTTFVTSLALLGLYGVACSSSDSADPSATTDGGTNEVQDDNVYVRQIDKIGFSTGTPTDVTTTKRKITSVTALVTEGATTRAIAGSVKADGSAIIEGVPRAPYVLELSTASADAGDPDFVARYPVDGAREIRLGENYWGRPGTVALTPTTKLALSVDVPGRVMAGDTFSWLGLRSYFYRDTVFYPNDPESDPIVGQTNIPADGDTSTSAWTFDGDQLGMPYTTEASGLPAEGDDLKLVQTRASSVVRGDDDFDPWATLVRYEAIGVLDVPSPVFTNETTNTITGVLASPPIEHVTTEIKGSTFTALRETGGYPKSTTARATFARTHEAGDGPAYLTSVAPQPWWFFAKSKVHPTDRTCFPPGTTRCEPSICPIGCENASDGLSDPGDVSYAFDAPRLASTGMRDVDSFTYSYSYAWTTPDEHPVFLYASASVLRPASSAPVELQLGAVRNVRINGTSLPWDTTASVAKDATLTFEPPTLGTAETYGVTVIELVPDLGIDAGDALPRQPRNVAYLVTRDTSVKVPANVLRSGRYYYVRVSALKDGRSFDTPSVSPNDTRLETAVFTPAFIVE